MRIGGHPGQWDDAGLRDDSEHLGRRLPVHRAVFDIDGQPLETRPGEKARREGAAQVQPASNLDLAP